MNIGVKLDRDDFSYDVHSLVKAFYPDDAVQVFTETDAAKAAVPRDLVISVHIPDYEDRKAAKDSLKKDLYRRLSEATKRTLPWGTLSGIRPTKIPTKLMAEGKSREEIASYMKEHYLTSDEKIDLAIRVAENENRVISPLKNIPGDPFCLYLHVPFCPSICLYCTFSASPIGLWRDRADEYLEAMLKEMRLETETAGGKRPVPVSFYIGGGTPTSLSAEQLDRLLDGVRQYYDIDGALERTVEAGRPDSITREKLRVLKKHGIDRISVNPQTMNDGTLELIGRRHTAEDTVRAFTLAREEGFANINMDIILGLPGEDIPEVMHTLREIERLAPDSLTIHSLAVKRASRLNASLREAEEAGRASDYSRYEGLSFSNSGEIIGMAYAAAERLGMEPYYLYRQKNMKGGLENTGFSVPGKECLYNILIMEDIAEIRAFGAAASKKKIIPGKKPERIINPKDVRTYLERQACI